MKKFIETIKNIFKIEELRKRIVYTCLLLLVYRLGCFVVLPGIDATMLASLQSSTQNGLVGLLNMFSGGAFGNASIFALGVMPYISASIVIQLLGVFVPSFRKLQMEGESGRKKMNQMTRALTILIICIQGPAYMAALHNQFELAVESLDDNIDETDKLVKKLDKNEIPHAKKVREFLDDFAKAYKSDPKKVNKKLFNKADDLMEFEWDKKKDKTPENLLEACHDSLEKALMYEPLALSQKGAEMVLLTITVKQHLDMATLMNAYIDEKWQALKTFDQDFKNEDFKLYLKEGTFLNVKGKTFLDWLAELYPAYEDAEKTLKLMEKDVEKYNKLADKGASDKRTAFLWFKKSVATPIELVEKINDELEEWKNTIEAWSEISSDANVKVVLAENTEFAEKVLGKYDVSKFRLESLDPDDDSVEDIDLPPYVLSDSLAVEGAADVLLGD